jgi:LCP family protein required for cell wall assembly
MNSLGKWKKIGMCIVAFVLAAVAVFFLFIFCEKRSLTSYPWRNEDDMPDISYADSVTIVYGDDTYVQKDDVLTFLLMGIDDWEKVDAAVDGVSGGQSDALFLIVMDLKEKSIDIVSINRNSMVLIDWYDEDGNYLGCGYGQITLQHAYGDGMELSCERTVNTVSRTFYQIPINGYFALNMGAIGMVNNTVGGIELESMGDFDEPDFHVKKGDIIDLDGIQAFYYLRSRDTNEFNSVSTRMERQRQYLTLLADKMIQMTKEDITFPKLMYDTLEPYMVTDITIPEFFYLATQVIGYDTGDVEILSVPGEMTVGEKFEEYYIDTDAFYQLFLDLYYNKE